MVAGCWDEPDSSQLIQRQVQEFQHRITESLRNVKDLRLLKRVAIPDGGTIEFLLATDSGQEFRIAALHQNRQMEGREGYQKIFIVSTQASVEFELKERSPLESRLVALLENAKVVVAPGENQEGWKPTPESRDWLVSRVKNRLLPWAPCP
jgi:hypothetical protein